MRFPLTSSIAMTRKITGIMLQRRGYSVEWVLFDASVFALAKRELRAGIQVQHGYRAACVYIGTALKDYSA